MNYRIKNLQGRKFGRLTVLRDSGRKQKEAIMWFCLCACGNFKEARSDHLRGGRIKSCGCLRSELSSDHLKKVMEKNKGKHHSRFKHGGTGTKLHDTWRNMKARCFNPNTNRYKYFGGKGIKIFDEWKDDFIIFKRWALMNGYKEGLTIDRTNKSEGYKPGNCQWMTKSEHSKKTREEA